MSQQVWSGADIEPIVDRLSTEFFREDPSRMAAFAHPMRIKIIRMSQVRELSAKEASDLLDEPIGKVSYHFRVLADAGFLDVVRQTPRRGAIETHYRARFSGEIDDETWVNAGSELRHPVLLSTLQGWLADAMHEVATGGFDLDGAFIGNAHFEADEEGLEDLRRAFSEHYERLLEIEAAICERTAADPDADVTPVNMGFTFHGGARRNARNGPLFLIQNAPPVRLIPEEPEQPC